MRLPAVNYFLNLYLGVLKMSETVNYKVVNGTSYRTTTPAEVVAILERSRQERENLRLVIFYGDTKTGQAWGDIIECFVSYLQL